MIERQCGRLHLPSTAEVEAMKKRLLDYQIRISEDANELMPLSKLALMMIW